MELPANYAELIPHFPEPLQLFLYLFMDVSSAVGELDTAPVAFRRRNLVRSLFALVEAFTHLLKQSALRRHALKPSLFSAAEVAMLQEEAYMVSIKGVAETQPRFVPTDSNLRFAVSMAMRDLIPDFTFNVSVDGWAAFKDSLSIRHRITHPKDVGNLQVTDDELKRVVSAVDWFLGVAVVSALHLATGMAKEKGIADQFAADEHVAQLTAVLRASGFNLSMSKPAVNSPTGGVTPKLNTERS